MINGNSNIVLGYLKSYFRENTNPLTVFDIDLKNLSIKEIANAFEDLSKANLIELNEKYIYPCVVGIKHINA